MDIGTSHERFQRMIVSWLCVHTAIVLLMFPSSSSAQPQARAFDLRTLQQAAIDTDPRLQQLGLLNTQSNLRLRNISALRLPTLGWTNCRTSLASTPPAGTTTLSCRSIQSSVAIAPSAISS